MNITVKRLKQILVDFRNDPDGGKYLCSASSTFAQLWNDDVTRERLRRAALAWLDSVRRRDFVAIGRGQGWCLFYPDTFCYDMESERLAARAVRLAFLQHLSEQREQRSASQRKKVKKTA